MPKRKITTVAITTNQRKSPGYLTRAGNIGGGRGGGAYPLPPPPTHKHTHTQTFLSGKKKNGNKEKTRKSFKAETIKKLSPRSKCYCFSHSRASRIQKLFCRPTMMADSTFQCSVASPI